MDSIYTYHRLDEEAVTASDDAAIRAGLVEAFPTSAAAPVFAARRWWRLRPAWRWVARDPTGAIAAHIAVHDLRLGSTEGPLALIGIAEVYTRPAHRQRGLVRALLDCCHRHARERGLAWSGLFGAARHYASSGYRPAGCALVVDGAPPAVNGGFHICPLHPAARWPQGPVDLGGPTW